MKTKQPTKMNIMIHLPLAMILVWGAWSPVHAQPAKPAMKKMPMEGKMMEGCKAMMEKKQEMMKKMKAQDAALGEQAAKMNSAPSDTKTALMADVVTQLVEQRMARDKQKAKMEEKMMKHMMQHMEMGKESMAKCPTMKGMKGMDDKSSDDSQQEPTEKE